jgi:hypothetical protein
MAVNRGDTRVEDKLLVVESAGCTNASGNKSKHMRDDDKVPMARLEQLVDIMARLNIVTASLPHASWIQRWQ